MIVKIFTSPSSQELIDLYQQEPDEFIIGVEEGAYMLAKNRIAMDRAVGDFDSVTQAQKKQIAKYAEAVSLHEEEKDETDTELAVQMALNIQAEKILIYGGIGTRFDHAYANMMLLRKGPIVQIDLNHKMYILNPGTHKITNHFSYISFFALEDVMDLTLDGFYYSIAHKTLSKYDPLCISNKGSGRLRFKEGQLLVIHAND